MLENTGFTSTFHGLYDILELYSEIDERINRFKMISGIKCIEGCGQCCNTGASSIEATIMEMLPLSLSIWQSGHADKWLENAGVMRGSDRCIFFPGHRLAGQYGCCTAYTLRPVVCRLFAFSTRIDKYGNSKISLCAPIRNSHENLEVRLNQVELAGEYPPVISVYAQRIYSMNPVLSSRLYPINQAFFLALEYCCFRIDYIQASMPDTSMQTGITTGVFSGK